VAESDGSESERTYSGARTAYIVSPTGGNGWPPERIDGPEPAAPSAVVIPPVVYVPCAPTRPGDGELTVDLRQTRRGQLALLVYSALDRLVDCCGQDQPWTVMATTDLESVRVATGFEIILMDLEIPEEHRRRAEVP
jgi:hypothetical protein